MLLWTLRYDFSMLTVTLIHTFKTMAKAAITSAHSRSAIHPISTLVNYKTNVHKSTLAETNLGDSKLLNSVQESSGRRVILGDGTTPWLHSLECAIWPSVDHFNHLTTKGSCQRVKRSHSKCQKQQEGHHTVWLLKTWLFISAEVIQISACNKCNKT